MASFKQIQIYTDGAAKGNPGRGGLGIVLIAGPHRKEYAEGYLHTTNNRMELLAVIRALEMIQTTQFPIHIYSDSRYVVDAINKGWLNNWLNKGFQGKKNPDLWLRFVPLFRKFKPIFHWVKGHHNNVENQRCDTLAVAAANSANLLPDNGYKDPA